MPIIEQAKKNTEVHKRKQKTELTGMGLLALKRNVKSMSMQLSLTKVYFFFPCVFTLVYSIEHIHKKNPP